jgi:hypothetical protein
MGRGGYRLCTLPIEYRRALDTPVRGRRTRNLQQLLRKQAILLRQPIILSRSVHPSIALSLRLIRTERAALQTTLDGFDMLGRVLVELRVHHLFVNHAILTILRAREIVDGKLTGGCTYVKLEEA